MIGQMFKDITKKVEQLESFKDIILETIEDYFNDADTKLESVKSDLTNVFKVYVDEKFLKIKQEIEVLKSFEAEFRKLKDDFNKLNSDIASLIDLTEATIENPTDIEQYLQNLKVNEPETFNDRLKMIKKMEVFVKQKGYGGNWYQMYKKLT